MKIYERVVIDIDTGEVLEEDGFVYDGPVALCKGSQWMPNIPLPEPAPPPPLPPPPKIGETEQETRGNFFEQMLGKMRKGKAATLIGSGAGVQAPVTLGIPSVSGERRTVLGG